MSRQPGFRRMSHASHNALLTTNAIVTAFYGVVMIVAPLGFLSIFGLSEAGAEAAWMARLMGTTLLGIAALSLFARNVDSLDARRAIDGGFLVATGSGLAITMWAQYLQVFNALGWIHVGVYGAFAVGFFYFLAGEDRLPILSGRPA
jgi:hypothetical protein